MGDIQSGNEGSNAPRFAANAMHANAQAPQAGPGPSAHFVEVEVLVDPVLERLPHGCSYDVGSVGGATAEKR